MKKLKRSSNNKIISGVCGGLGEYFNVDPTIIRILWFILTFPLGTLFLAYIACSIIIPMDDGVIYQDETQSKFNDNTPLFIGGGFILLGISLLSKIFFPLLNLRIRSLFKFWPILLIVLGIYIITNQNKKN